MKFSIPNEQKPLLYFSPRATARTTSATASADGSVAPAYARRLVRAASRMKLGHWVAVMVVLLFAFLVWAYVGNASAIEVVR